MSFCLRIPKTVSPGSSSYYTVSGSEGPDADGDYTDEGDMSDGVVAFRRASGPLYLYRGATTHFWFINDVLGVEDNSVYYESGHGGDTPWIGEYATPAAPDVNCNVALGV